jgi:hypothetical protein
VVSNVLPNIVDARNVLVKRVERPILFIDIPLINVVDAVKVDALEKGAYTILPIIVDANVEVTEIVLPVATENVTSGTETVDAVVVDTLILLPIVMLSYRLDIVNTLAFIVLPVTVDTVRLAATIFPIIEESNIEEADKLEMIRVDTDNVLPVILEKIRVEPVSVDNVIVLPDSVEKSRELTDRFTPIISDALHEFIIVVEVVTVDNDRELVSAYI